LSSTWIVAKARQRDRPGVTCPGPGDAPVRDGSSARGEHVAYGVDALKTVEGRVTVDEPPRPLSCLAADVVGRESADRCVSAARQAKGTRRTRQRGQVMPVAHRERVGPVLEDDSGLRERDLRLGHSKWQHVCGDLLSIHARSLAQPRLSAARPRSSSCSVRDIASRLRDGLAVPSDAQRTVVAIRMWSPASV